MSTDARPVRARVAVRWASISLRSLMVLIFLLAFGLARETNRARAQRRAIEALSRQSGPAGAPSALVTFDRYFSDDVLPPGTPAVGRVAGESSWHRLVRHKLGNEYFRDLRSIEVFTNPATIAPLMAAADGLGRLEVLRLDVPGIRDEDLVYLQRLGRLKTLMLNGSAIRGPGLKYLGSLRNLERLDLSHLPRPEQASRDGWLASLHHLARLRRLWISSTTCAEELRELKGLSQIESLALLGTRVDDDDLDLIEGMAHLKSLDLLDARILGPGLTRLERLPSLTHLALSSNPIVDEYLAPVGRLTRLKSLSLGYTPVGSGGMVHLANLTELESLVLCYTNLDDEGLRWVGRLPRLQELNLNGTEVSDAGLRRLASLRSLRMLCLSQTRVTAAGVQELRRALPSLVVQR